MEETLTVTRLGITGRSNAPCNPPTRSRAIFTVRRTQRNVKHWPGGDMCLRWTAAGMLEAERNFRRINGKDELARLAAALGHELQTKETDTVQAA